ncbi:MAG: hypothetical protein H6Q15_813 [Bacteroidetes bacterium]|nr:hypothetical protein [Bacteroidota bacterium]
MKTIRYIIISILLLSGLNSFSQTGYLGKRWHFQMDTKFANAYVNPCSSAENWYDFNIMYSPTVEYILDENWSIGGSFQFQSIKYRPSDLYEDFNVNYDYVQADYYPIKNSLDMKGYSIFGKYYTSSKAPLGYYYKFQIDYITYKAYSLYEVETNNYNLPKEKIYTDEDWAMGFRIEFGKTVFLNNFLSLGTGLSCGLLTKGYSELRGSSSPMNDAAECLLVNYFFGVNISLGVIPF